MPSKHLKEALSHATNIAHMPQSIHSRTHHIVISHMPCFIFVSQLLNY